MNGLLHYDTHVECGELDLNECARVEFKNIEPNPLLNPYRCEEWLAKLSFLNRIDFSYGGYMEDRSFLWRGSYLNPKKSIHLGVDVNFLKPGKSIYCPLNFIVKEIFHDTDQNGGWGDRVLVETENGLVIFAHLKAEKLVIGQKYLKGSPVGVLASPHENGGWFTHLHLQGIKDLAQMNGIDGYGEKSDLNEVNYPNPLKILEIEHGR
jgi:hypothetical protein